VTEGDEGSDEEEGLLDWDLDDGAEVVVFDDDDVNMLVTFENI